MSSFVETSARFDGLTAEELARQLDCPHALLFDVVDSTLDIAHAEAAGGAAAGTIVLADEQSAGRGRQGRRWTSRAGQGIWLALIERPRDLGALDVLALRCGLEAADALESLAPGTIGLKWPNDLLVGSRKLAGILIETRWRGDSPDWVAIGFGLNVSTPDVPDATGLRADVSRLQALQRLAPAIRRAATRPGHLDASELQRWRSRDVAIGRQLSTPAHGISRGIDSSGALLVETDGIVVPHRSGSLTFSS